MYRLVFRLTMLFIAWSTLHFPHAYAQPQDKLDTVLDAFIKRKKLTGDPTAYRSLPSINDPLPQLGKKLFFTTLLSGSHDTACASCHHPLLGGGDNLSLPRGSGTTEPEVLGMGRKLVDEAVEGPKVPRNALTTFNVGLFDKVLLWDGAVQAIKREKYTNGKNKYGIDTPDSRHKMPDPNAGDTLPTAVARFPVVFDVEMRGTNLNYVQSFHVRDALWRARQQTREALSKRLDDIPEWKSEFAKTFGDDNINYKRIAKALGEYMRSQVFVNNKWKSYVGGDKSALTPQEKRGAVLFVSRVKEGGANCAGCHRADRFTDERFHVIGLPQIGRGKADGGDGEEDFGRFRTTRRSLDKYAFRTPSLLNVEVTGPYGRTGAYFTLEAITRHHLDIEQSLKNYDYSQLEPTIRKGQVRNELEKVMEVINRRREMTFIMSGPLQFTDSQIQDLVAFLKALTDPCVKDPQCLQPWIPNPKDHPKLGILAARDGQGIPLQPSHATTNPKPSKAASTKPPKNSSQK